MRRIALTGKHGTGKFALVDDADVHLVDDRAWWINTMGYAWSYIYPGNSPRRSVLMHRVLVGLDPDDPMQVDHINRDKLDNRRENLRTASPAQNSQNVPAGGGSSAHRGVTWHAGCRKWQAQVKLAGRNVYLGLFATETDAARAAADYRREHMPFATPDDGMAA